jgi:hypothetical protein
MTLLGRRGNKPSLGEETMVDIHSPNRPLTVYLPTELIAELQLLAEEKHLSVDEVVREACLEYTEPYIWERDYKAWLREHPNQPASEFGLDGDDLAAPETKENQA